MLEFLAILIGVVLGTLFGFAMMWSKVKRLEAQIAMLEEDFGVDSHTKLTKAQASKLIEHLLETQKNKAGEAANHVLMRTLPGYDSVSGVG